MADAFDPARITIPHDRLPADGRFGSGPSKVRPEAVAALTGAASTLLGTSHRQAPIRKLVGRVRAGISELFGLPDGYEVVLGNGGSTAFWDIAAHNLVRDRAQHLSFGEFSAKFASVTGGAPFLGTPTVVKAEPGTLASPYAEEGIDAYAWPHNETSTGVMAPSAGSPEPTRTRWSWSTRPRVPVVFRSTSPSPTSTTSHRRSASPPTVACGWP